MEAYADWIFHFPRNTDAKDDINTQEPFSRQNDLQFYMICLKILFSAYLHICLGITRSTYYYIFRYCSL